MAVTLNDEMRRRLLAAMMQRAPAAGAPGRPIMAPGMLQSVMQRQQGQQQPPAAGQMAQTAPGQLAPGAASQLPGATSPEQAAAAQYEAQIRAQQQPGARQIGGGAPMAPSDQAPNTNIFAGTPGFYSGMFDVLKKTSPFSGFYTPQEQSGTWL